MKKAYQIAVLLALLLAFSGCRHTQTIVEKPVLVHDTTYVAKEVHDSTYVDRWRTVYQKGDTVWVRDSFAVVRYIRTTDTAYKYIEKPVEITVTHVKEVEKQLTKWQSFQFVIGRIFLVIIVLSVVYAIFRLVAFNFSKK